MLISVGRSDKIFCNKHCQNYFNNLKYREEAHFFEKVEKIVRKNFTLLNKIMNNDKVKKVESESLIRRGYKEGFCTYVKSKNDYIVYNIRVVRLNNNYYEISRL